SGSEGRHVGAKADGVRSSGLVKRLDGNFDFPCSTLRATSTEMGRGFWRVRHQWRQTARGASQPCGKGTGQGYKPSRQSARSCKRGPGRSDPEPPFSAHPNGGGSVGPALGAAKELCGNNGRELEEGADAAPTPRLRRTIQPARASEVDRAVVL